MAPRLITDKMLDLFPQNRTPGHHVSSALHNIMQQIYPNRFTDDPPDQTRMNLGNAMEKALIAALSSRYPDSFVVPGELWHDGYLGTPDLWYLGGLQEFGKEQATVEIKLTWASARRADDIEGEWFWRYWQQLRSYGYMAGMRRGILIIVFINGDYRGGQPVGLMWDDKWADEELVETWDMVRANTSHEDREAGRREHKRKSRPAKTVEESLGSLASLSRTRSGTELSAVMRSSTSAGRKRGRSGR